MSEEEEIARAARLARARHEGAIITANRKLKDGRFDDVLRKICAECGGLAVSVVLLVEDPDSGDGFSGICTSTLVALTGEAGRDHARSVVSAIVGEGAERGAVDAMERIAAMVDQYTEMRKQGG